MDPISAFSFAVNILTVVDISAKLISTASEIRSSGDTVSNKELAADAQRLKSYCQKFSLETATKSSQQNATSSISSEDDATLRLLASEAKGIADDIQDNLLKLNKQRSFMRVFRQSIRNTRKQPEMKCKAERLKEMQDKIIFSIIVSLHSSVGTLTLKDDAALARLDENTRSLIQTILSGNDTARAKIETQMASLHTDIAKNHVEMMGSSGQRHDELLSAIRVGPTQHEAPERESAAEHKERVTRSILDKLWFSRIKDRYEDIKPAHQKTFEWIFSAEAQMESSCSFYRWIEQGSGLYWISGKAGTGKSTLMKFLADHERTKALLQHWTKGQEYVTANYWFWDQSQDPLQKSMEGLYRGLLYDVISKETSLAPLLFPDQFIPERQWQLEFPTPNGLRRAFNRLVSMEASTVLVVLLIDGLDEYEATEIEQLSLSESLKAAAQSHHMKIIASSRPETVFENAFKDCDKLYLHELTYSDQTSFTKDSLYKHERMQYLASLPGGKEDAAELIRSAAKKSEGIFLWLRLVVDSLVQELDACDVIKDLQRILDQFPRGLEKLFLHMMGRIREDRRQRGFIGLLVMQRALAVRNMQSPRSTMLIRPWLPPKKSEVFRYFFNLTAICLDGAYTDLDRVVNLKAESLSGAATEDLIRKVENRLRGWSAGLLELGPRDVTTFGEASTIETQLTRLRSWSAGLLGQRPDLEVHFMHRSVAEFLDLPTTRSNLMNTLSGSPFDVDLALMQGLLVKIKREVILWGFHELSPLWDFVEVILRIARQIEDTRTDAVITILKDLDRTLTLVFAKSAKSLRRVTTSPRYWTDHFPWDTALSGRGDSFVSGRRPSFLSIAVESGLAVFTIKQLENPEMLPLVKTTTGFPLLGLACRPPPFSLAIPGVIRPEIIRKLIELGADPNQRYLDETSSFTPWERMLQTAIDLQVVSIKGAEQLSDMLTMFIKGGADLRVVTHVRRCDDLVAIEGFGVPDDQQVNPEYLKHDPLVVQDVVRYAFLHGNLPALMSRPFSVLREFVPFQDLDACWGTSMHEWRWQAEGLYLVGSDPANVKRADEKAIRELGHRLLELIHVSGNADSKVVEDLDNNEQEQ